jgi:hypothetical protein
MGARREEEHDKLASRVSHVERKRRLPLEAGLKLDINRLARRASSPQAQYRARSAQVFFGRLGVGVEGLISWRMT